MRFRLLAFIPPAALISAALLVSASSLVSALEATFVQAAPSVIAIERFETRCEVLDRKIGALSRAATSCDQDLQCLRSPILCPIAMDEEMERDYRALREERYEQCGVPRIPSELSSRSFSRDSVEAMTIDSSACSSAPNWQERAASGRATKPNVFVF